MRVDHMSGAHQETVLFGRAVAYTDWPGEGPAIVLVHGMGSSGTTWGDVPALLAQRRRVVVVDLPGHGRSDAGTGDYSLGALASTLRDLMDTLALDRAHFVGHSLGGGITMQFAYQFPDRVASLTLESSGGLGPEASIGLRAASLPGSDLVLRVLASRRLQGGAAWLGTRLDGVGLRPNALGDRALDRLAVFAARERRAAFLATLRSVVGPEGQRVSALERLALVDGRRVLIVWGGHDSVLPAKHGRSAHDRLPGSTFVLFAEAGHEPHADDSARFARVVDAHIGAWEAMMAV